MPRLSLAAVLCLALLPGHLLAAKPVAKTAVAVAAPTPVAAVPPLSLQDQYKPMLIDGDHMPKAVGKRISELSLQAVVNGLMEPVPYQVDEYNTGGAVYFPNVDVPLDGKAGILDPNDKLLFVYKDAGPRRTAANRSDGNILSEIELTDTRGVKRYVYLVEGSRLRSEEQYVRYSTELAQVETDFYSLVYSRENQINWEDFAYTGFTGDKPLDSMKLRMTGGLVTSLSEVTLNNDNFIGKPVGENVGPIRTTSQMMVTVWLVGLPLLDVSYQVHHYPKSMVYDVRVVMPEVRRKALVNPRLMIALDANQLIGGVLQTAKGPAKPVVVDGSMSPDEKNILNGEVARDNNWIWLSTRKNFDVLSFFDYLGDTSEPLSLVYVDDTQVSDEPERFKGAVPMAGYRIDNFPQSGFFGFVVSMFLNEGFSGDPAVFTQSIRSQPVIRVLSTQP